MPDGSPRPPYHRPLKSPHTTATGHTYRRYQFNSKNSVETHLGEGASKSIRWTWTCIKIKDLDPGMHPNQWIEPEQTNKSRSWPRACIKTKELDPWMHKKIKELDSGMHPNQVVCPGYHKTYSRHWTRNWHHKKITPETTHVISLNIYDLPLTPSWILLNNKTFLPQ